MPECCKVAIVAALEREVWPLVKDWPCSRKQFDNQEFKFYEGERVVVICGGIGAGAARRASEAVITLYNPGVIISVGFAGALDPALAVGHAFTPRQVIDATDGSRTDCADGNGILLTFGNVADVEQKAKLGAAYGAHAVDMEAASVARSAEAHGLKFLACKAISDTSGSALPPMARFITNDGKFHTVKFLSFIAVRPWLWAKVRRLATNSRIAARNLCGVLAEVSKLQTTDRVLTR
jgi:adenosylhomocysteine nucleosidase